MPLKTVHLRNVRRFDQKTLRPINCRTYKITDITAVLICNARHTEIITTLDVAGSRRACRRWIAGGRDADVAAEARPAGVGSSARRRSWLVRGQDRGSRRKRGVQRRGTRGSTGRPEDVDIRYEVMSKLSSGVDGCRLSTNNHVGMSEQFAIKRSYLMSSR